jgi:hypothetical protein
MSAADFIVLALVLALIFASVLRLAAQRKNPGCGGCCSSCHGCGAGGGKDRAS